MTRYTDAALLTGEYAHLAAQLRAGERAVPGPLEWEKTACDNQAEEAAQDVAKHIFAFQQSLDPETEQLEVVSYSAAGQIRVLAVVPGEGDLPLWEVTEAVLANNPALTIELEALTTELKAMPSETAAAR